MRYFYDTKKDNILNWNEFVEVFINDLKSYLFDDDKDLRFIDYTMNEYIDDEVDYGNIQEFENIFEDDLDYQIDLRQARLMLADVYAISKSDKFVDLKITIKKILDNKEYDRLKEAMDNYTFTDNSDNTWYCELIDRDLLFYQ